MNRNLGTDKRSQASCEDWSDSRDNDFQESKRYRFTKQTKKEKITETRNGLRDNEAT